MNKPKVLILTSSYPKYKGDVNGNFVYELAIRLKNDFDIFVLAPAYNGSINYEIIDDIKIYRHKQFFIKKIELAYGSDILAKIKKNILYFFVIPFYLLYQLGSLSRVVKKEGIQLIHAHWLLPQGLIAVLYKGLLNKKIKIVVTAHGADINNFDNSFGNRLKKYTLKRIDQLTVVSNAFKERVIELGYKEDIYVYPMGIDTVLFSPDKKDESIKAKYNIHGCFLLFVGGLIERKGIRYLIQAMPAVINNFPSAKMIVIGDGNMKDEMVNLAKKLNLTEIVIFIGSVPHHDLPTFFATADLFIFPSFSEGFGLVAAEALSCKTLTVASNLEVIHDIISENETGFFFKEINKDSIAEKIIYIIKHKQKFEDIREKGRNRVINEFDWQVVRTNYINLFNKVVSFLV